MTWPEARRLDYVDWRLTLEGEVNRGDLMAQFGVSVGQASKDINRYIALHPDAMVYDRSAKMYRAAPDFATRRGWTPAALAAMAALAEAGHALAFRADPARL